MENKELEPEWLTRVRVEKKELSEKIAKLVTFLGKEELDLSVNVCDLYDQLGAMIEYQKTLNSRILNELREIKYRKENAEKESK